MLTTLLIDFFAKKVICFLCLSRILIIKHFLLRKRKILSVSMWIRTMMQCCVHVISCPEPLLLWDEWNANTTEREYRPIKFILSRDNHSDVLTWYLPLNMAENVNKSYITRKLLNVGQTIDRRVRTWSP